MSIIKSYGIIAMRRPPNINHHSYPLLQSIKSGRFLLAPDEVHCEGCKKRLLSFQDETDTDQSQVTFVMYQRKHTNAFWDIVTGKATAYNLHVLVQELTCQERSLIKSRCFSHLWDTLGLRDGRARAMEAYMLLETTLLMLIHDVDRAGHHIPHAEIGFPKGRRNGTETPQQAALREFCEETGYRPCDVTVSWHEPPIEEEFRGSDGRTYRCIYYLGWVKSYVVPRFDFTDPRQGGEVLNVGFFTAHQAEKLFRPYEDSKRDTLRKVIRRAKLTCPVTPSMP